MADRFYKDIEVPDLPPEVTLDPPEPGFIQVFGRSGKLAVTDSQGQETMLGQAVDAYTKTEADAKFLDAAGDSVTGDLTFLHNRTLHRGPLEPANGETMAWFRGHTSANKQSNATAGYHYLFSANISTINPFLCSGEVMLWPGSGRALCNIKFSATLIRSGAQVTRQGVTSVGNGVLLQYSVEHLEREAAGSEDKVFKLRAFFDPTALVVYFVLDHPSAAYYAYNVAFSNRAGLEAALNNVFFPQNTGGVITDSQLDITGLTEIPVSFHRRGVEFSGVVGATAVNLKDSTTGFEPTPFPGQIALYGKDGKLAFKDAAGTETVVSGGGSTQLKVDGGQANTTFNQFLLRLDFGAGGASINPTGTP